jgi:hypothetical protein
LAVRPGNVAETDLALFRYEANASLTLFWAIYQCR